MVQNRDVDDIATMLWQFLHTLSDGIGGRIAAAVRSVLPSLTIPPSLASAIALLAVVSVVLGLAKVAQKALWIAVLVGWVLVVVRLVLFVFP